MNNVIEYSDSPATLGGYALIGTAAAMAVGQLTWSAPETPVYAIPDGSGTYSTFMDQMLTAPQPSDAAEFAREISEIYAALVEGQEPLGAEFEAVWDANVADLYEC